METEINHLTIIILMVVSVAIPVTIISLVSSLRWLCPECGYRCWLHRKKVETGITFLGDEVVRCPKCRVDFMTDGYR